LRNLLLADDVMVFACMNLHARAHVCIKIWMFHFIFDSQIYQKYEKIFWKWCLKEIDNDKISSKK